MGVADQYIYINVVYILSIVFSTCEQNMNNEAKLFFINELLFTDSSSSDESIDDELYENLEKNSIPKMTEFEEVVDQYSEEEFRKHFRMYRTTFDFILNLIGNKIASSIIDQGRHTIAAKIQLLLALWYFATPDSYRSICSRFNIGNATALRSVRRVTDALLEMAPQFIKWPNTEYADEVMGGFDRMGFPDTIGAVDGSYIPIPLPKEHGISYLCRKNFPAIILQAVCDHRMLFTHCYAGEVGSVHDARVLRNSEVWSYLTEEPRKFPRNSHLVGDKAYPCLDTLLTPFRDNGRLTRDQTNYNYRLSCARSTIERAFGLLKKRMRCLKFLDVRCMSWIPKYIIVCCMLHNICILQNDVINIENVIEEEEDDVEEVAENMRQRGGEKRNIICNILANG